MSTSETDPENSDTTEPSDATNSGGLSGLAGWVVVAVLVISGLVAPVVLYWAGQTGDLQALGLGFKNTYLAIPMIPAILLGAIGIWTALKHR